MTDALDDVAAIIGRPGALALASLAAGPLYIPRAPRADSWLVVLLGELMAGRLAAEFGGATINVPRPPIAAARVALVRELRAAGVTVREISARVNLSERRIYHILATPT